MIRLRGIPAARGYAFGPAYQFRPATLQIERSRIEDAGEEIARLDAAVIIAIRQINAVIDTARTELGADQVAIFEAQLLMVQDPELLETIRKTIAEENVNAEFAVKGATEHSAQLLENMEDPYFRARAADVRDIAQRLLGILLNIDSSDSASLTLPSIVVANDLAPSDTVLLDKRMVRGFCTEAGSETSHTAILARGLGIPAVVGAGAEILSIPHGTNLVLDGFTGEIFVDPTNKLMDEYKRKNLAQVASAQTAIEHCHEPAITQDGRRVEVVANIGSVDGAKISLSRGAEGVGLLRTEFLYMERAALPTEEEQYQAYADILDVFGELPVVLRTSDIGGDKGLPYLQLPKELNPFLGMRGLRLALLHPARLLKPQLRAALRAGKGHDLRIMFPMVAELSELRRARQALDECIIELTNEGKPVAERLQVGVMVEVPSAAVMADILAPQVDFFSIGTNDLTQYTLAADRTNPKLAYLVSAFSPSVLRLIQNVILQAHKLGKWVGVCGELAGESLAIPVLLGMGLDEFSMNPQAIPRVKQILRGLNASECQELADQVLLFESADEVRSYVQRKVPSLSDL